MKNRTAGGTEQEPDHRTRRHWLTRSGGLATATAGAVALAACGAPGAGSPAKSETAPAELTALHWSSDPASQQRIQATAQAFQAQRPNVGIQWAFSGGSGALLLEKLLVTLAGGTPPDISMMQEAWIPQVGTDSRLLVLDSNLKNSKVDMGDFVPALRQYMGYGDGKTRYLPWYTAPVALFYNDTHLKEAGVASPPPRSWDELVQQGQKLVKTDGAAVTRAGVQLGTGDWVWLPFLWGNGGQFEQNGKIVQNSPQGIEALQFFTDVVRKYRVQGVPAPTGGFDAGNVAMLVDGAWNIPARRLLQGLRFATAPIPSKQAGAAPHPVRMEGMMAFSRQGADTATWQYLDYLMTPEVMIKFATESGFVPARTSARRSSQFTTYLAQEPAMKAPTDGIESTNARAMPMVRGWMQIKPVIAKMITEAQAGERNARDILDDYTRQIQDLAKQVIRYPADLHSHTTFSDGKTSLELSVRAAEAAGLEALAITDHLWQPGVVSGGSSIGDYLAAIGAAQTRTAVHLLRGVETTAVDAAGTLGIDEETAERLDLVLCDMGGRTRGLFIDGPPDEGAFLEALRRCMVAVCERPSIDVFAHPFNVGRLKRDLSPATLPARLIEEVCAAAAAHGTAFEVMNDMHYWFPEVPMAELTDGYAAIVATACAAGCRFTLGADAHHHQGVGNLLWSQRVLERARVPHDRLIGWRTFVSAP